MSFQLPPIKFQIEAPDLNRTKYTTRALLTNLHKRDYDHIIQAVLPENVINDDTQHLMNWLSNAISERIIQYNQQPDDNLLEIIFHSIQIWGGNSARGFYLNKGVEHNLNLHKYRQGVDSIKRGDIFNAIALFKTNIRQMNIAFASKHFSFWTSDLQGRINKGPRQLPILDRLLFKMVYKRKLQPSYRHYLQFVDDIYNAVNERENITVHSLERQLFNFADTIEGRAWMNRI